MLAGGYAVLAMIIAVQVGLPVASVTMECDGNAQTANSTFPSTLKLLAAGLPGKASTSPNGFATAAVGTVPGVVYGMALCRGDTNSSSCSSCLAKAFSDAQASCPGDTGAAMYEDGCVLRFSVQRFLDFLGADQWQVREITFKVTAAPASVAVSATWFDAAVRAILTAVSNHAVSSSQSPAAASSNSRIRSTKYFATGEEDFNPRIYGLAQCMPNLAQPQCDGCLRRLQDEVTPYLQATNPRWVVAGCPWCILRYSVRPIYDGQAMLQLRAPPPPSPSLTTGLGPGNRRSATAIYIGIACSLVLLLLILSVFAFIRFKRKIKTAEDDDNPFKKMARALIFNLSALQEATGNFSEANKLGAGGYGIVYKGILPDGQEIAVKKLLGATQHGLHQLRNEVLLLAELQHKNLVRLQGFCSHRDNTLLVYEYIKNGSLDNFIFDASEKNTLNWEQQYNIILGIARESCIFMRTQAQGLSTGTLKRIIFFLTRRWILKSQTLDWQGCCKKVTLILKPLGLPEHSVIWHRSTQ